MQPYFFPYLGHFALIASTDQWVVFDVTQYTPRSWMNRNRVLHPQRGWIYVNAPLAQSSISLRTHEARLNNVGAVHQGLLGKLSHYRRKAPHYDAVIDLVNRTFAYLPDDSLVSLNVSGLAHVCAYLELHFDFRICSELELDLHAVQKAGGWAPEICRQLGASSYLNPVGGRGLFDIADFQRYGIELAFLEFSSFSYETGTYGFEPGLSILDVMMWNTPQRIRQALLDSSRILS